MRHEVRLQRRSRLGLETAVAAGVLALCAAVGATAEPAGPGPVRRDAAREAARAPLAVGDLPPRPALTLLVFDVQGQLASSFDVAARETAAIFAEMGVAVIVKAGHFGTTYDTNAGVQIPVIVLNHHPAGRTTRPEVLGLVLKQASHPALWILAENIRRTIGIPPASESDQPARDLGMAVGRVIAHEVVHALAPAFPHTSLGLMRSALNAEALTSASRLTPGESAGAVRRALGLPAAPGSPLGSGATAMSPADPRLAQRY